MCVPCGGGAGRGPWGGAFSAQSLRRASLRASTPGRAEATRASEAIGIVPRTIPAGPYSQPATAASAGGPPPWPRRPRGGARPTRGVSPAAARRRAAGVKVLPAKRKPEPDLTGPHSTGTQTNVFKYDYRTGFLLRMHRLRYNSRVAAGRARWGPVLGAGLPRAGVDAKWSCPPPSPMVMRPSVDSRFGVAPLPETHFENDLPHASRGHTCSSCRSVRAYRVVGGSIWEGARVAAGRLPYLAGNARAACREPPPG
jgi:hypothetical protein